LSDVGAVLYNEAKTRNPLEFPGMRAQNSPTDLSR